MEDNEIMNENETFETMDDFDSSEGGSGFIAKALAGAAATGIGIAAGVAYSKRDAIKDFFAEKKEARRQKKVAKLVKKLAKLQESAPEVETEEA